MVHNNRQKDELDVWADIIESEDDSYECAMLLAKRAFDDDNLKRLREAYDA